MSMISRMDISWMDLSWWVLYACIGYVAKCWDL